MTGEARIAAGFDRVFYGVLNSSGYMIGQTAAGATAGSAAGEGMARLEGARTIPIGIAEDDVLPVSGDNEPLVSFSFPGEELPNGVLEMAVRSQEFESLVQGTRTETLGDVTISALGPSGASKPDMALLLQRKSKKWQSGVRGSGAWEIVMVLKSNVTPLGSALEQRQFSPYRYGINLSKSDRLTYGATFTELQHGTTSMPIAIVYSDNPMLIHAFQGDASRTAFTLPVAPKSASKVYVYVNGTRNYPTISGTTVTFGSPPASGAMIGVFYEVDENDLP
jgi:hypothetical protein